MPHDDPAPLPSRAGVIASASPQASQAGADVLRRGGNAIDAAVAVSLALGVTEPAGSGVGGQAMFLIASPGQPPVALDGASLAPHGLPAQVTAVDLSGRRASTVPTTLRVLDHAHRHYGSGRIAWSDLVAPSIAYARDGFSIGAFRAMAYARYGEYLLRDPATAASSGMGQGTPKAGDRVTRPALATLLERVARLGAMDFYQGEIAAEIDADMRANGGWIRREDLAAVPAPTERPALTATVGPYTAYSLPPPGSGWAVLLALQILDAAKTDLSAPGGRVHLVQAIAAAQRERLSHPLPPLDHSGPAVAAKIDRAFANALANRLRPQDRGETTHFSVVDADGTMVGVTQSINAYFGTKVAHPTLGFLYNNYMLDFLLGSQGVSHSLAGGAKPYSYMAATALYRDDRPQLMVGSAGDDRILTSTIQTAARWWLTDVGIAAAVAAPRVHPTGRGEVLAEVGALDDSDVAQLEQLGSTVMQPRGHHVAGDLQPYFGGVHAVANERGAFAGGVDPRRDGAVVNAN